MVRSIKKLFPRVQAAALVACFLFASSPGKAQAPAPGTLVDGGCREAVSPPLKPTPQTEVDDLAPGGDLSIALIDSAEIEKKWPAHCAAAPAKIFGPNDKKFCLGFAADYFYRLRFTHETVTFAGTKRNQDYERPQFSTMGALFLLAQVTTESDHGTSILSRAHNYWGLDWGKSDYMRFPSFEQGFAFYLNHMERGINIEGKDTSFHPGWPAFLKLMESEKFTSDQVNISLNSGPTCHFPAYNAGRPASCGLPPGRQCPCQDYGGQLLNRDLPKVISTCLAVYSHFPDVIVPSEIYRANAPVDAPLLERRSKANLEMTRIARSLCGQ